MRALLMSVVLAVTAGGCAAQAVPSAYDATAPAAHRAGEPWEWRGRLSAGQTLEVRGANASIRALGTDGDRAEVRAVRSSRRGDAGEVEIRVVEHAGGATLCAVRRGQGSGCPSGDEGWWSDGRRGREVRTEFTVQVPAGVRLVTRSSNGGVTAESLDSDVDASTSNGPVRITGARTARVHTSNGGVHVSGVRWARVRTSNGSISAALARPEEADSLDFRTSNGSITLTLPAGTNAAVDASTSNGSITTDFPVTVQGRVGSGKLVATVGRGGAPLVLRTSNGSIRLRRAG